MDHHYSDTARSLGYDGQAEKGEIGSRLLDKQQALESFLAGVEKRAFRIAELATNDSDDALDIVQEAMFKLVEKYAHKDECEWGALFHRILQSRIHDWYRRKTVRDRWRTWLGMAEGGSDDALENNPGVPGWNPESEYAASRGMTVLEQAIKELPLRQQQAFLLRVWEGLDVRQTAKAMNCAEGSVKTHYSRAVHALRDKLGEDWNR